MFQFLHVASCPFTGQYLEVSGSVFFTASIKYLCTLVRCTMSIFPAKNSGCLSFSSYIRCSSPIIIFTGLCLICFSVCLQLGSPVLDTALWVCLTRAENSVRITSLKLLAILSLMQEAFGCLCCKDTLLAFSLSIQDLQVLFCQPGQLPACTGAWVFPGAGFC